MQLKQQAYKTRARVSYDYRNNRYTVNIGVTVPHSGTLRSCIQWCQDNGIPIRNSEQVQRLMDGAEPSQEVGL